MIVFLERARRHNRSPWRHHVTPPLLTVMPTFTCALSMCLGVGQKVRPLHRRKFHRQLFEHLKD